MQGNPVSARAPSDPLPERHGGGVTASQNQVRTRARVRAEGTVSTGLSASGIERRNATFSLFAT